MRIISPLVLIVGTEQILVIQILMAMHEDRTVLKNSFTGALVAILLNLLITSSLGAPGSAIVWVISELCIMILSIVFIRRRYHFSIPYRKFIHYVVAYLPLTGMALLHLYYLENELLLLFFFALTTLIYTCICEVFIIKNRLILNILDKFKTFCQNR